TEVYVTRGERPDCGPGSVAAQPPSARASMSMGMRKRCPASSVVERPGVRGKMVMAKVSVCERALGGCFGTLTYFHEGLAVRAGAGPDCGEQPLQGRLRIAAGGFLRPGLAVEPGA